VRIPVIVFRSDMLSSGPAQRSAILDAVITVKAVNMKTAVNHF